MDIQHTISRGVRRVPTSVVWAFGLVPMAWLFWGLYLTLQGRTGPLGVDPVKALEHETGLLALQFLVAGLVITPLRRLAGINLIKFRRALGLLAFLYLVAHVATWAILDVQTLSRVIEDILKRTYILVGMTAFVLLIPLAWTSRNAAIRKLGPRRWQGLHRFVYPAAILGGIHFLMAVKGWPIEPLLYLGAIFLLLCLRLLPLQKPRHT